MNHQSETYKKGNIRDGNVEKNFQVQAGEALSKKKRGIFRRGRTLHDKGFKTKYPSFFLHLTVLSLELKFFPGGPSVCSTDRSKSLWMSYTDRIGGKWQMLHHCLLNCLLILWTIHSALCMYAYSPRFYYTQIGVTINSLAILYIIGHFAVLLLS